MKADQNNLDPSKLSSADSECICAISTPPGTGGISVIRVSGDDAFKITRKLCSFLPEHPESHRIFYGFAKRGDEKIDEVLVACFAQGKSFTGDECTEISCHGSPIIAESIVQALLKSGARLAHPGEFSSRAFFNGRIDLVQAESILALIESQSKQAAKQALRQLEGELSYEYKKIEDCFLWVSAQIEAGIDFSTEGLDVVAYDQISHRLLATEKLVESLLNSYEAGRFLRDGIVVALVGKPNVGKSSLLNALLKEERSIVTDEPGTTRDLVSGILNLGGIKLELVDTAGIREAASKVEKIGIDRSLEMMKSADVVIHVLEIGDEVPDVSGGPDARLQVQVLCFNKSDLHQRNAQLASGNLKKFSVSAKSGDGLNDLKLWLTDVAKDKSSETQLVVSQARHFELLSKILGSLNSANKLIKDDMSAEFVAQELQIGIRAIHELLGKAFDEQVIDRIFKEFCLGK